MSLELGPTELHRSEEMIDGLQWNARRISHAAKLRQLIKNLMGKLPPFEAGLSDDKRYLFTVAVEEVE